MIFSEIMFNFQTRSLNMVFLCRFKIVTNDRSDTLSLKWSGVFVKIHFSSTHKVQRLHGHGL